MWLKKEKIKSYTKWNSFKRLIENIYTGLMEKVKIQKSLSILFNQKF